MNRKRGKRTIAFLAVLVVVLCGVVVVSWLKTPVERGEAAVSVVSYSDQTLGFAPFDRPEVVRRPEKLYAVVPQGLKLGARPYTDREYVITELPESLFGLTFLQTCNGHKGRRGPDFQVTLSLPEGAGVFLAVDERVFARFEATGEVPAWLKEYRVTEYRIAIDDPAADYEYRVLFKELGPGQTTLGEPGGFSSDSMYFVFFSDLETAKELAVQSEELPFGLNRPTQNGPPRRLVSEY